MNIQDYYNMTTLVALLEGASQVRDMVVDDTIRKDLEQQSSEFMQEYQEALTEAVLKNSQVDTLDDKQRVDIFNMFFEDIQKYTKYVLGLK